VWCEQNAPLGVVCIANLNHVLLLYKSCPLPNLSVDFDDAVNFSDKPITGKEPNRSCEQEETKDHDARVAKIQKGWGWVFYVEFGKEVMNAVDSEVKCSESAGKAPPPPVVVLRAEMEVAEQDCGLRARDDEDHEHEEQESVHVIDLTGPNAVEDEK